jgi:hypothetical protein
VRLIRALGARELAAGGGGSRVFTVTQRTSPVYFWVQIGLHVVAALVLCAFGLLLTGLAPAWLEEMLG